jgi:molybdopterin-guanine dinucleotide biosynthesis protein MobB
MRLVYNMYNNLPIFGVCGWSGSGKTTLLESALPTLLNRELSVVAVKHDVHGISQESSRKDNELIFHAGADAIVHGPGEMLSRCRVCDESRLNTQLSQLTEQYDLILVEGYKRAPWPKVWLTTNNESTPPQGVVNVTAVLPWDTNRKAALVAILDDFLQNTLHKTPIFGCVLIGGKSTRMGMPKHLLPCADGNPQTWLHHIVGLMQKVCHKVVLAGAGTVPEDLQHLPRMVDVMEIEGPMAGLLAAMRWAPRAIWLLAACDLPGLTSDALKWLLAQRRPGIWAVLPRLNGTNCIEPILACYDFRCRLIFEQFVVAGDSSLQKMATHQKAMRVVVPPELSSAWKDVDSAAQAFFDAERIWRPPEIKSS